jgi:ribosomal-protein-alanine N-acetyltransferase
VISIRPATPADLHDIQRIAAGSPTAPQWTPLQFRETLDGSPSDAVRRATLVATSGEEHNVLGFAIISALISVYPVEAELESIAVDPGNRGRGTGQALLHAAESWAASLNPQPNAPETPTAGATLLRLEVRVSNAPALRLYQGNGFQQTAIRPAYYTNPVEDAVCMERTIPQKDVHGTR